MKAVVAERVACPECDLIVRVGTVLAGRRASCPRCDNILTAPVHDGLIRSLAFALASCVLLVLANTFPFLDMSAKGLSNVMTLPQTALDLWDSGYPALTFFVIGPIVGIPALMLLILLALLIPLRNGRSARWLVPAGRFLFLLSPWSMVEVFVIGVLVSLVKIGAMASVVPGISFWAYIGFALCFTASFASLDRLQVWDEIEACTP